MPAAAAPFRQFVLKIATRCDLACDHCYVYQAADASWRGKPRFAAEEVLTRTAERIAEHAAANLLPAVAVVLHGGEPLLAGAERLRFTVRTLRELIEGRGVRLDLRLHTNGVRLDAGLCDLFREFGVRVGISLDGDRRSNDLHRRFSGGASSHAHVLRAVELLRKEYPDIYSGILCTIDVRNDPVAVYEALKAAAPPRADFLLPHATHSAPPLRTVGDSADYADWLLTVYDCWTRDGRPFQIRTFASILAAFRGLPGGTESLGLEPVDLVVVEADGTLEQVDSLKAAYDGAPETGFDVFRNTFDEASAHPGFAARRNGLADLCATCRACPVVGACGGGLRTHRYRAPEPTARHHPPATHEHPAPPQAIAVIPDPFDHPSVYCRDLKELIMGIKLRGQAEATTRPAAPPTAHRLPAGVVDDLAHGFGGAEAIAHLTGFQQSLRRLLLAKVFRAAETVDLGAYHDSVQGGIKQLKHLDGTAPGTLREVLAHPYMRAWAVRCLEEAESGRLQPADLGHLAALAAATAIRAGADADVDVPIRDGAVHLPTLGRLVIGTGATSAGTHPAGTVTLHIRDGLCSITAAPGWQHVRGVPLPEFGLTLEDTDPYRHCHHWDTTDRLPDADAQSWLRTIPAAWDILRRDHPAYVPALAAGLTTIVPLAPSLSGRDVSATARHAYGSIGAALPLPRAGRAEPDAAALALLMIHEFQHGKLGAVLDMADLHDPSDARLFDAPWREDPRPLEGLLQGTYAHVGVTDFWRVRRFTAADDSERAHAAAEFERWLGHTVRSCRTLAESGSLTPLGLRFTTAMRETMEPWLAETSQAVAR